MPRGARGTGRPGRRGPAAGGRKRAGGCAAPAVPGAGRCPALRPASVAVRSCRAGAGGSSVRRRGPSWRARCGGGAGAGAAGRPAGPRGFVAAASTGPAARSVRRFVPRLGAARSGGAAFSAFSRCRGSPCRGRGHAGGPALARSPLGRPWVSAGRTAPLSSAAAAGGAASPPRSDPRGDLFPPLEGFPSPCPRKGPRPGPAAAPGHYVTGSSSEPRLCAGCGLGARGRRVPDGPPRREAFWNGCALRPEPSEPISFWFLRKRRFPFFARIGSTGILFFFSVAVDPGSPRRRGDSSAPGAGWELGRAGAPRSPVSTALWAGEASGSSGLCPEPRAEAGTTDPSRCLSSSFHVG